MNLKYAKRLQNRDQITLRSTGEVGIVLGEPVLIRGQGRKRGREEVQVPALFPSERYIMVLNREID